MYKQRRTPKELIEFCNLFVVEDKLSNVPSYKLDWDNDGLPILTTIYTNVPPTLKQ